MTTENDSAAAGNRNRLILVVLAIIFVAPVLGAWLMFNFTDLGRSTAGKASHGHLILPPRKIADMELIDPKDSGQPHRLYGKWSLVYLVSGKCSKACEDKLYTMRQLRLAMGRDAGRLQRVLIVFGDGAPVLTDAQADNYKGQLLVRATEQIRSVFKLKDSERPQDMQRLYIVDPRGNLLMSYVDGTDPLGIIKDLKRLLQYSSIG